MPTKPTASIPKSIFRDLVKSIQKEQQGGTPYYWYSDALDALQMDTEEYVVEWFQDANNICKLLKHKTLQRKHFLKEKNLEGLKP